jgi:tetratricopeptide (TPR) repeat protein
LKIASTTLLLQNLSANTRQGGGYLVIIMEQNELVQLFELGSQLFSLGKDDEALKTFEKALGIAQKNENKVTAINELGIKLTIKFRKNQIIGPHFHAINSLVFMQGEQSINIFTIFDTGSDRRPKPTR